MSSAPELPCLPSISLIIPILNEERLIPSFFQHLSDILALEPTHSTNGHIYGQVIAEIIVVDGQSIDTSPKLLEQIAGCWAQQSAVPLLMLQTQRGRDQQLNAALSQARHDIVLCCPIDVRLAASTFVHIQHAVAKGARYGCLYQRSTRASFKPQDLVARLRARYCCAAYMDQAPFFLRSLALQAGGFRSVGSYDSADLARRIGQPQHFCLVPRLVLSSCRAWRHGFWRQTLQHQRARLAYWLKLLIRQSYS